MFKELQIDNQICFRLYSASRLLTQAYRPMLTKLGITYPQYLVLMILWEYGDVSVSTITEKLMLETNTVTPLLKRMEEAGIIKRKASKQDGRQKVISLTARGKALEEKARDIPKCLVAELANKKMNIEELQKMAHTLDNLIKALL